MTDVMAQNKEESVVAAEKYMVNCYAFAESQSKALAAEIAKVFSTSATAGTADTQTIDETKLNERTKKLTLVNDVIDLGNWIRTGTWHAIATRDP